MKKLAFLLQILLLTGLFSCEKVDQSQLGDETLFRSYVLQKRNVSIPFGKYPSSPVLLNTSNYSVDGLLGRSYYLNHFPIHNTYNLGLPVLDVEAFRESYPDHCLSEPVFSTRFLNYAFYSLDRFEEKYAEDFSVSGDISVNIFNFKSSFEAAYSNRFSNTNIQENERVYGYTSYEYRHIRHRMLSFSEQMFNRLYDYLSPDFMMALHYSSADEIVNAYGPLVLSDYTTGASANAYFIGRKDVTKSIDEIESSMTGKMSLGFSDIAGLHIGAQQINSGQFNADTRITEVSFALETQGGAPADVPDIPSTDASSAHIDLSSWVNSLSNPQYLSIANIDTTSLIKLSNFVEEENLRNQIDEVIMYGVDTTTLHEPYIYIYANEVMGSVTSQLVTRRGDRFDIQTYTCDNVVGIVPHSQLVTIEYNAISEMFPDLRIVAELDTEGEIHYPFNPRSIDIGPGISLGTRVAKDFNITAMKKFVSEENGKTYLLTTNVAGDKVAYVLYDNYIIYDYTFSDLVESLETENQLTLEQIRAQYRLIAL